MGNFGTHLRRVLVEWSESSDVARVNMRTQQVRERYRQAIESVYRDTAPLHLSHTNAVIITKDKTLIVYVDDSLFAAELNAQRELIKLRLLELFGEDIVDFQIRTSRWKKYRDTHPYLADFQQLADVRASTVPLDPDEKAHVADVSSRISDKRLRKAFAKAMTADLEWKKGERVENLAKT